MTIHNDKKIFQKNKTNRKTQSSNRHKGQERPAENKKQAKKEVFIMKSTVTLVIAILITVTLSILALSIPIPRELEMEIPKILFYAAIGIGLYVYPWFATASLQANTEALMKDNYELRCHIADIKKMLQESKINSNH